LDLHTDGLMSILSFSSCGADETEGPASCVADCTKMQRLALVWACSSCLLFFLLVIITTYRGRHSAEYLTFCLCLFILGRQQLEMWQPVEPIISVVRVGGFAQGPCMVVRVAGALLGSLHLSPQSPRSRVQPTTAPAPYRKFAFAPLISFVNCDLRKMLMLRQL
jgi:hypothetical protein